MKASDIVIDNNISILLKAPPGYGKTLAAASFALDGPVYMAYFDKQKPIELVNYFSQFGAKGQRVLNNIEYDVYGAHNCGQYLEKVISLAKECRYIAVISDSITQMTSAAVNWSLSFRSDRKNKEKLKVIPDWDEYKVETSLVTQVLDLFRGMPTYVIWTAHPIPGVKIEGSGSNVKVTKVNPIVSYGSKVAGIVPGNFSEIYQFSKSTNWDPASGKSTIKYLVSTDAIGDDYAKSNIGLTGEFDITNQFFYEVWKEQVAIHKEKIKNALAETNVPIVNPFANSGGQTAQINPSENRKWNSEKGAYE